MTSFKTRRVIQNSNGYTNLDLDSDFVFQRKSLKISMFISPVMWKYKNENKNEYKYRKDLDKKSLGIGFGIAIEKRI